MSQRLAFAALGLLACLGTLALGRSWHAQTAEAGTFPTRVQAVADEFRFSLSRSRVPAGRVTIELVNFGEDPHNFKVKRDGGTRVHTIGETAALGICVAVAVNTLVKAGMSFAFGTHRAGWIVAAASVAAIGAGAAAFAFAGLSE